MKLTAKLPPVANMARYDSTTPNAVEVSLGAITVEVLYPGLFDAPTPFKGELGARATMTATLVGNDRRVSASLGCGEHHCPPATPSVR